MEPIKRFRTFCLPVVLIFLFYGCALINPQVADIKADREVTQEEYSEIDMPGLSKYPDAAKAIKEAKRHCEMASLSSQAGDSKAALAELDKAYSILLSIDPKKYPELAQSLEDLRYTIAKRIIQVQASKAKGTKGVASPIPMVMNRHVKEALDNFQGPLRDFFMRSYNRSLKYRPMIVAKLKAAGLPEELSWLPLIESGFNVRAFSPARALGMWQFIASTGHKYGLKRDEWVDERMDPEKSTDAAILYLKELHGLFGDWTTALAAYNCGEGNVLRVIRTQQIDYLDNFWDLYERLPKETAFYVPQFIAVLHIIKSPKTYNFDLPESASSYEYDTVQINKCVSLSSLEAACNFEEGVLSSLNPELRRYITPPYSYQLKIPKGKKELILAALETIEEFMDRPKVAKNGNKKNGQEVQAATKKTTLGERNTNSNKAQEVVKAANPTQTKGAFSYYTVKKGDTLQSIAASQGVSLDSLKKANRLSSNKIAIGQRLAIPKKEVQVTKSEEVPAQSEVRSEQTRSPKSSGIKYTVKKGDSLYTISKRFGMTLSEIMELNNLKDQSIYPGQVLTVRGKS